MCQAQWGSQHRIAKDEGCKVQVDTSFSSYSPRREYNWQSQGVDLLEELHHPEGHILQPLSFVLGGGLLVQIRIMNQFVALDRVSC